MIKNGLQQGTVNAPILFNIYTSDLPGLLGLNERDEGKAVAFADDLLIYVHDVSVDVARERLQNSFINISEYYKTWKLKINVRKCETILFRPPMQNVHRINCVIWRDFYIKENVNSDIIITHKKCIKYLGVILDEKLYFTSHIKEQIKKARAAYFKAISLFQSKYLY